MPDTPRVLIQNLKILVFLEFIPEDIIREYFNNEIYNLAKQDVTEKVFGLSNPAILDKKMTKEQQALTLYTVLIDPELDKILTLDGILINTANTKISCFNEVIRKK